MIVTRGLGSTGIITRGLRFFRYVADVVVAAAKNVLKGIKIAVLVTQKIRMKVQA